MKLGFAKLASSISSGPIQWSLGLSKHGVLDEVQPVRQTLIDESVFLHVARQVLEGEAVRVRQTQHHVKLPIGRTARIVFELDTMRAECSRAAQEMLAQADMDGNEFEECARLDDALAEAHRLLKSRLRTIMLSRISRHSKVDEN